MKQESVLSAHPVSDDMRALIAEKLADIERQHQVTVLYACESGSRAGALPRPTATMTCVSFTCTGCPGI